MIILNFIRGFCMSLADSVPGVSGGTMGRKEKSFNIFN